MDGKSTRWLTTVFVIGTLSSAVAQAEEPGPTADRSSKTSPTVQSDGNSQTVDVESTPSSRDHSKELMSAGLTDLEQVAYTNDIVPFSLSFERDPVCFLGSSFKLTGSAGGELRYRYMDETDRLRPGGPGRTTYDLWRTRAHVDMTVNDLVQGYVEAIDAAIFNEDLPVTPIDENRSDLLRYYVDARLAEFCDGRLNVRIGRQFLKYGSQHLVSPLAWANTFRNFEGVRAYYSGKTWDVDGFWTKPVNSATGNLFRPRGGDHPDQSRDFSGVYATFKGMSSRTVDFYWLFLNEREDRALILDGERHTFGVRIDEKRDVGGHLCGTVAFELEGAFQVGQSESFLGAVDEDIRAGMLHTSLGFTFTGHEWHPSLKGLFYWGSGDDTPGDGENENFHPLFPLGHAYWGIIDNLNGSNLLDYGLQASAKPAPELTLVSAVHWFRKHEGNSPIFNVGGVPVPAGATTTNALGIGTELDLIATYAANDNLEIQAGYSWFWYGDAIDEAAAPLPRNDAKQFYLMTTLSF